MSIIVRSNEPKTETPQTSSTEGGAEKATAQAEHSSAQDGSAQSLQNDGTEASETSVTEGNEGEQAEAESTDAHESATDTEQTEDQPKAKQKKSGFQKRIDRINQQKAELAREVEYWKREALNKGATEAKEPTKTQATSTAPASGEPQPDNFETHAAYVKAVARWEAEQVDKENAQKAEKSRIESEQARVDREYAERVEAFRNAHDDFDDMMDNLASVPRSHAVEHIIKSSENGPELLYELAKDPKEAQRIARLSPILAAREMGKLEARITSKTSVVTETKKITNAPKPLTPVGTGGKGAAPKSIYDADKMTQSEYEKERKEQIKKRRQAG